MYNVVQKIVDSNTSIIKSTSFFLDNHNDFEEKFKEFVKKGVIIDTQSFEEKYWRLYNEIISIEINFELDEIKFKEEKNNRNLDFSYQDVIRSLKYFILIILEKYKIKSVDEIVRLLKKTLLTTNYFNENKITEIKKLYKEIYTNSFQIQFILDYIDYFEELEVNDIYYNYIEQEASKSYKSNIRLLPSFETMFKLVDIIELFVKHANEEVLEKYFPIVLWWYITTRIPMRTTEFTIIPYDCLEIYNEKCYLKFRRSILKGHNTEKESVNIHSIEGSYKEEEREITTELYDLITRYKAMVNKYDYIENFYNEGISSVGERRFLLSYRSYFNNIRGYGKNGAKKHVPVDYLNIMMLTNLFNQFYSEIVCKQNGRSIVEKKELQELLFTEVEFQPKVKRKLQSYEVERIQLMDTRHMAIINMLLQDIPYVVIKELAGHKDIQTTYGYANQLERYIENYTYYLARKYARQEATNPVISNELNLCDTSKILYMLEKIENKEIKAVQCNNGKGWCTYKKKECDLPEECEEGCKFYTPKFEHIHSVIRRLYDNKNKISTSIKVIKEIIKNRKIINDVNNRIETEMAMIKACNEQNAQIIKESMI